MNAKIKQLLENLQFRSKCAFKIFQERLKIFIEKQKRITADPKAFYLILKEVTRHFCYNTSLHGYRYISLIYLSVAERFVWTFVVFCAFLTALSLIFLSLAYENLKGATLNMIDSTYYPIYQYPFPAITLCSFNRISRKKALDLADRLALEDKDVPNIYNDLMYLANLFYADDISGGDVIYKRLEETLSCMNMTADEALMEVTPSCMDLLLVCKWKGRITRCDSLFQETVTPEGICCSFNHFNLRNRKFTGYNAERYKYTPKKLVSCGSETAIKIVLQTDPNDYYVSQFPAVGVKLLIHHPYNYPEWNIRSVMISPLSYTSVSLVPYRTYTTSEVFHLNEKDRGCIFNSERQLRTYTNYTHENCLNECRIRLILKLCNCIPFYYLNTNVEIPANARTCNMSDIPCLSEHRSDYLSSIPGLREEQVKDPDKHLWGEETDYCNCPPSCETFQYVVSETSTNLAINKIKPIASKGNVTIVNIFYKNLFGTLNKMDVYKRWHALLGLLGGLLGLCIGFSITGAFDIIYYYILRLMFDISSAVRLGPQKNPRDLYKNATTKIQLFHSKKRNVKSKEESRAKISSIYKSMKPPAIRVNISDFRLFKNKQDQYFPYLE